MVSAMGRLMDARSTLGAFIVGNGRSSLRGREYPIVRGGRSLKVYHWRQVERCGGTGTKNVMRSLIYLALIAVLRQICMRPRKKDPPV